MQGGREEGGSWGGSGSLSVVRLRGGWRATSQSGRSKVYSVRAGWAAARLVWLDSLSQALASFSGSSSSSSFLTSCFRLHTLWILSLSLDPLHPRHTSAGCEIVQRNAPFLRSEARVTPEDIVPKQTAADRTCFQQSKHERTSSVQR